VLCVVFSVLCVVCMSGVCCLLSVVCCVLCVVPLQAFLDGRELIWPKAGGCVLCVCINLHWSLVSETRPLRRACWAVAMACVAWGNELVDTFWAFELALASFPSAPCVWPCLTHFEFKRCSTSSEASMHTPAVAFDFWKACSFNL